MDTNGKKTITIEASVQAPVATVWQLWTEPQHITQWSNASDDWHTPRAENDLRKGGRFMSRMEAKDGSMGFDFGGEYDDVKPMERIAYTIGDGRKVDVHFKDLGDSTHITETFEAESENPEEMQRGGWQSILDNFKKYAETAHR